MSDQPRQNRRSWQNLVSQSLIQSNFARFAESFKAVQHRFDNCVCRVIIKDCVWNFWLSTVPFSWTVLATSVIKVKSLYFNFFKEA